MMGGGGWANRVGSGEFSPSAAHPTGPRCHYLKGCFQYLSKGRFSYTSSFAYGLSFLRCKSRRKPLLKFRL